MRGEDRSSDRRARLEQARADRDVLHVEHSCNFRWRAFLDVAEDEDLALPHGKRGRDRPDERDGALAVDAHAGVCDVWIASDDTLRWRGRRRSHAEDDATGDTVEPGVEGSVTAERPQLSVDADEHFLGDVLGVVLVAGEGDGPAEDDRAVVVDEGAESGLIPVAGAGDELGAGEENGEGGHHMKRQRAG